jgi:Protein of unknown function (DUF1579)
MRRIVLPLTMTSAMFVSGGALAQQRGDPQSAYEPRSAAGAGQEFLAKFVGEWLVTKKFFPRSGAPVVTMGECRQTMIHGGRFLQSNFVFGQGQARTSGLGLIGYDVKSELFTSVWTDSRSTRMSIRQSRDRFDGRQIVLFSRSLEVNRETVRQSRTVTTLEDQGRRILHRQYTVASDGKERVIMELDLARKGAGGARQGTPGTHVDR